jgi:hypothetical protein
VNRLKNIIEVYEQGICFNPQQKKEFRKESQYLLKGLLAKLGVPGKVTFVPGSIAVIGKAELRTKKLYIEIVDDDSKLCLQYQEMEGRKKVGERQVVDILMIESKTFLSQLAELCTK